MTDDRSDTDWRQRVENLADAAGKLPLSHTVPGRRVAAGDPAGRSSPPLDLVAVARHQRGLRWIVIVSIGCQIFALSFLNAPQAGNISKAIAQWTLLGVLVVGTIRVVQALVASSVSSGDTVLIGIVCLIPCFGLLAMLTVSMHLTDVLRNAGVQSGFFGARDLDAQLAMNSNLCHACGYNLYGNVSGRCPECGEEMQHDSRNPTPHSSQR